MVRSNSIQPLSDPDPPKPKGRFTGERLKVLRPEVYRRVVDLLAEPREHVPYDHICRLLHVSEHTVKAIEKSQSISIAERKERLLAKALRIADKAADRIEDQIDSANITQATIAFGVATEKMLLLNNDPAIQMIRHSVEPGPNLYEGFQAMISALRSSLAKPPQPALPCPEIIAESNAETGS